MFISVIIPTYNGAHKIGNLLDSLKTQIIDNFEIIVVVDGSQDHTLEILCKYKSVFKDFSIINQENGGRSKSRNAGARLAKGELLVFFDDDMRLEPSVLQQHLEHHVLKPNTICIGTQLEEYRVLKNDIQHYKAHCSRKWAKPLEENNGLIPKNKPYLTAAHFSIPKVLFEKVNGFDENLTDAEDYDLAVRLSLLNIDIYYKKTILGWHDDFISLKSYIKRVRQYTYAHIKLVNLKPDLYKNRFSDYQPNIPNGFKLLVYRFFASPSLLLFIENKYFVKIFPQKMRFKIYAITVAALGYYFKELEV